MYWTRSWTSAFLAYIILSASCVAASAPAYGDSYYYYWKAMPVGKTAELLTLFCRSCYVEAGGNQDIPLIAVLRDTLGDTDPENDRIFDLWLLTRQRPRVGQRILSALPFFYWHVGHGSQKVTTHDTAPLIDLSAPEQPVISGLGRRIVQWAVLDPMARPVRAASRTYRANQLDDERLHLEETISYLQKAPVSDSLSALTQKQVNTIIARLELRKHVLGGLVNEGRAARLGEELTFEEERIRSRNWELLRLCAEKTGLMFEPLNLAGSTGHYGILWFPLGRSLEPAGLALKSVWRLLNIKDPWSDNGLRQWNGITFVRSLNGNGSLLPFGDFGFQRVTLAPLAVYSLNYPKVPLLLVDFRDESHLRHSEMIQRALDQLMSGVIGISHFTNWYLYAGIELYEFIAARHGSPMDQAARLDSYSRFRVELAWDRTLDPVLRKEMDRRVDALNVNPLVETPDQEMRIAARRYVYFQSQGEENSGLRARLDDQRRSEIASFGETTKKRIAESLLHDATFGRHNHRVKKDAGIVAKLDCYRRIRFQLTSLDAVVDAGTQPEVAYESSRLHASIAELSSLVTRVQSPDLRSHVAATLKRLGDLSQDAALQAHCSLAIASLKPNAVRAGLASDIRASTRTAGATRPSKGARLGN